MYIRIYVYTFIYIYSHSTLGRIHFKHAVHLTISRLGFKTARRGRRGSARGTGRERVRILKCENVERERCAKRMNVRAQREGRKREWRREGGGREGAYRTRLCALASSMKENT